MNNKLWSRVSVSEWERLGRILYKFVSQTQTENAIHGTAYALGAWKLKYISNE